MTTALLTQVQEAGEDFEWYPTTEEIIEAILNDCISLNVESFLDVGAGNGKVIDAFDDRFEIENLFAIEKSQRLIKSLRKEIVILGTDFHDQSFFDKHVDVMFCNPPYSEFESWVAKLVREASCKTLYLVIPVRWSRSKIIGDAMQVRRVQALNLGEFRFCDSEDRKARGRVNAIRIDFDGPESEDGFDSFFADLYPELTDTVPDAPKIPKLRELAVGKDYVETLVGLYLAEMEQLQQNYQEVGRLHPRVLKEFEISVKDVREMLKRRIKELKNAYWKSIFDNMTPITSRLTSKTRDELLRKASSNTQIDFSKENVYAVVIWAIKNANDFIDQQLIEVYERMMYVSNCENYVSNSKVFKDDHWNRHNFREEATHVKLQHRIVMGWCGFNTDRWNARDHHSKLWLNTSGIALIEDLSVVARTLGFEIVTLVGDQYNHVFQDTDKPGQAVEFYADYRGERILWATMKAYRNGNLHLKLNGSFTLALNAQFGKLKGWVHSHQEVAREMKAKPVEAMRAFRAKTHINLDPSRLLS
jgi:site-specific DNA-adenine methylase